VSKMENGQLHNAKNFTSPRKNRFQKFRFKGWNFLCDVNAFFYHQEKVFLQYVRVRHWFSTGVPWKALWVPSISDLISIYNSICCKLLLEVPPNCSITKASCSKFKKGWETLSQFLLYSSWSKQLIVLHQPIYRWPM